MYNFILGPCDTDSISFCKEDMGFLTKEDRRKLLDELNSIMPESIVWDDDGYYFSVIAVRAKNYILKDENGKIKIRGSALKATQKEQALKEFINKVIEFLLEDKKDDILNLYKEYVKEIYNIKDISRWVSKKTLTEKIWNSERTNETKVLDAIEGSDYVEGDRCFMYFDTNKNLKLQENWNNDHDTESLLKKLYNTIVTFETVLDIKQYPNYSLKRNLNEGRLIGGLEPLEKKKKSA